MKRITGIITLGSSLTLMCLAAALDPQEKALIENPRQLTLAGRRSGEGYFSKDGTQLVFQSERDANNPFFQIYNLDLTTGDIHRISPGTGKTTCAYYHPDGKRILFAPTHHDPEAIEKQQEELVMRTSGKERRYASTPGSDDKGQLFMANWNHEAARDALRQSPVRKTKTPKTTQKSAGAPKNLEDIPVLEAVPGSAPGRQLPQKQPTLSPQIIEKDLQTHVRYLASDALEGRMTGEKGARLASEYIAKSLNQMGIQSIESLQGFYQSFEFSAGVEVDETGTSFNFKRSTPPSTTDPTPALDPADHFRPLAFSENGSFDGDIVFAGYGLKVPGDGVEGYNSYAGLNVSNKVAMVLRYVPEDVESERRVVLNRYASLRYKALIARELGASGLLVVTGPNSPSTGQLIPIQSDQSLGNSGILAGSVTAALADALLASSGKTLKELQDGLDQENPHATATLEIPDTRIQLEVTLNRLRQSDRNVIGILHPPHTSNSKKEYVVLGAHYDHLGYGETGGFQVKGEENQIHNGADDNASGVAAVLEIAGAIKQFFIESPEKVDRGVLFAFWSGEELGLIGSSHFTNHAPIPLESMIAYLNFDMVGRLRNNKLTLQGLGSSADWKALIEKRNIVAGFQLSLQEDPYLPTDTTAFYPKEIPVLSFFTGSHEAYHRPGDDYETLEWSGLQRISTFANTMVIDLIQEAGPTLQYSKMAPTQQQGNRDTLRVYLGTIPDYTTEVEGVKLTGVRDGGPADKAGLKAGDIIQSLSGQTIKNIYDYTYALDALKIDVPAEMTVMRDGKSLDLKIIPTARP